MQDDAGCRIWDVGCRMWDAGWLAWHAVDQGNCELGCHVGCYLTECPQFLASGGDSTLTGEICEQILCWVWVAAGETRLCSLLM